MTCDIAPTHVAFYQVKSVGALIASFRSSIPSPPVPLFTLRRAPRGDQRKTRGRVVRYLFLVGLLHSLLHAGLSRRTDLAIITQYLLLTACTDLPLELSGNLLLRDSSLGKEAVRFAARSESVEKLSKDEQMALEEFVKFLSEK